MSKEKVWMWHLYLSSPYRGSRPSFTRTLWRWYGPNQTTLLLAIMAWASPPSYAWVLTSLHIPRKLSAPFPRLITPSGRATCQKQMIDRSTSALHILSRSRRFVYVSHVSLPRVWVVLAGLTRFDIPPGLAFIHLHTHCEQTVNHSSWSMCGPQSRSRTMCWTDAPSLSVLVKRWELWIKQSSLLPFWPRISSFMVDFSFMFYP